MYLGPQLPRWRPRSVAQIQAAIDDGTLTERHWIDVKREVKTSDGDKKELARDLASFAIDGGVLVVGVGENKTDGTLHVTEQPLTGLSEQVEQVARSRCDPPLFVVCQPLRGADPSTGMLLVEVPPSPLAPHMVEGRYYGRGDKTKITLTDPDVARLHASRTTRQLNAEQIIAREIARDPAVAAGLDEKGHLFVVAQPLASPPDLLTNLLSDDERLRVLIAEVAERTGGTNPNWTYLDRVATRDAGKAVASTFFLPGRLLRPDAREASLLEIELSDNGRLALFCGRGTDGDNPGEQYVLDGLVVTLTRALTALAGVVGADQGYAGRWLLVVGVTGLSGKPSSMWRQLSADPLVARHDSDIYIQSTEAVTAELRDRPGTVTRRLVGRLLRTLQTDKGQHDSSLADPP